MKAMVSLVEDEVYISIVNDTTINQYVQSMAVGA